MANIKDQGFAKQNYTMLDNLKLGYGGTKEEMARLIEDASKMTDVQKNLGVTVDASSMSFGNIVNAISVMQSSMGIAGTTAKEAASTISGSASMVKASWTNLVTGMADENADLETLVENLTESIGTFADNLLPRIDIALKGIVSLIGNLAPKIAKAIPSLVSSILPGILEGATSIVSEIVAVIPELLSSIVQTISEQAPQIMQSGLDMLLEFGQALIENAPLLIDSFYQLINQIASFISENASLLVDTAKDLISAIANGLLNNLPRLIDSALMLVKEFALLLIENAPALLDASLSFLNTLIDGIVDALPDLVDAAVSIIEQLVAFLTDPDNLKSILTAAVEMVFKLVDGIVNNLDALLDAAVEAIMSLVEYLLEPETLYELVKAAAQIVGKLVEGLLKFAFKIGEAALKLVSQVWETIQNADWLEIGKNIVLGLWDGIKGMAGWLLDKISGFCSDVFSGICDFFGIESPSKLFRDKVGKMLVRGIGVGFEVETPKVSKEMEKDLEDLKDGLDTDMTASIGYDIMGSTGSFGGDDWEYVTVGSDGTGSGSYGETTISGVEINIYADTVNGTADDIAEKVAEALQQLTDRRSAVYG